MTRSTFFPGQSRIKHWALLLGLTLSLGPLGASRAAEAGPVLARVESAGAVSGLGLPAYAVLQDGAGKEYRLVLASEARLRESGASWQLLAREGAPEEFVIATEYRPGARAAASRRFTAVYDDGRQWIVRANEQEAEELAAFGFGLARLGAPLVEQADSSRRPPVGAWNSEFDTPDPLVSSMVRNVQTTNLWWLMRRLSGIDAVVAGGEPKVLATRHMNYGPTLQKATQFCFERLRGLGLTVFYHEWASGSYANSNVVATLPGAARANEFVLVTAHIDDMPSSSTAPGADDNTSGCAAVLTAAGILSQYQFERSVRFILFTGEEQGLLGSAKYAGLAYTNGDAIVAVLNLDMIGWDGVPPTTFQVHTRTTGNPGYTNDLALAAVFTNAAAAYGLVPDITPIVRADALSGSDHASFWNRGYPAICASEDYGGDFNPYYHTANDTFGRMSLSYFTAAVRAAVATAAHLATPLYPVFKDVVQVTSSDWTPGSSIGAGVFAARHLPGATETGIDVFDLTLFASPPNPYGSWLKVVSSPYPLELVIDSRPLASETRFAARLVAATPGTALSCPNRLRFDFPAPPAPNRLYTARITVPQPSKGDFVSVTDLRQTVTAGGEVSLPALLNVGPEAIYGTCDIAARFLDTSSAACRLRLISASPTNILLVTDAQIGTRIVDEVEYSTAVAGSPWIRIGTFTNEVAPDAASFDSGWAQLSRTVDTSSLPAAAQRFFRVKRTWLAP